jgi:hypothetical protein
LHSTDRRTKKCQIDAKTDRKQFLSTLVSWKGGKKRKGRSFSPQQGHCFPERPPTSLLKMSLFQNKVFARGALQRPGLVEQ